MSKEIKKIVMLGDRSSGKTCYMLGMYAGIPTDGRSRFSMNATDIDEGMQLSALWAALVNETGKGRWPPITDQAQTYNFELCYGYNLLQEFEWLDYYGRAMLSQSSERDVQILRDYITESSCLFLCISGQDLRERITWNNRAKKSTDTKSDVMGKYLAHLGKHLEPEERKNFPIVIVITKYDDCCSPRLKTKLEAKLVTLEEERLAKLAELDAELDPKILEELKAELAELEYELESQAQLAQLSLTKLVSLGEVEAELDEVEAELIKDVKEMFPSLFAENSNWLTMICPISLGIELAENPDSGAIAPINLHLPVIFALFSILRKTVQSKSREAMKLKQRLKQKKANRIIECINRRKIKELETDLQEIQREVKDTRQIIATLGPELLDANIYLSGKEIKIDLSRL